MASVKVCPQCGRAYKRPFPAMCADDMEDLIMVPITEEKEEMGIDAIITAIQKKTTWLLVSEDGEARLSVASGDAFNLGREHTLKEYLKRFSMVGRLQARIEANGDELIIKNLGRTNKIMVDGRIVFEDQSAALKNGSRVILGRNPDEMGGYDDRVNCAFFRVEKVAE